MSMTTSETTEQVSKTEVFLAPVGAAPVSNPVKPAWAMRVFHAAANSAEFFDHMRAHYRESRRTPVEIQCGVRIVLSDGTAFDEGSAEIRDVSPSGALLGGLKMGKGVLPLQPFKMKLLLKGADYEGIVIEATPVRICTNGAGLGVKFDEILVSV